MKLNLKLKASRLKNYEYHFDIVLNGVLDCLFFFG